MSDRVVFDCVIAALVHGSGYERVAVPGCSDRTIGRRLHEWAAKGLTEQLLREALTAFEKMIGLQLGDIAVDGCITKALCGGERAGRSPVDRGKGGLKRSLLTEGHGLPVVVISVPANRHDSPLEPTLDALTAMDLPARVTAHLDAGYDSAKTCALLDARGYDYVISRKAPPTGRTTLESRTDPLLDERLRQTTPLHRKERPHRRLLPRPGRRTHRHPRTHPRSPNPLPLAHPTNHPTTPINHQLPVGLKR